MTCQRCASRMMRIDGYTFRPSLAVEEWVCENEACGYTFEIRRTSYGIYLTMDSEGLGVLLSSDNGSRVPDRF